MPYLSSNPKRHPLNKKLRLFYEPEFHGRTIQHHPGYPMVQNYLEKLWDVTSLARVTYNRVYAVRIDLRFPKAGVNPKLYGNNGCLKRFFANLQRELDSSLKYNTRVLYAWAREQKSSEHPHYHVLLMLNGDAIRNIGDYRPSATGGYKAKNLYHRIARSWAGAIGLFDELVEGLVHISTKPGSADICEYFIKTNESGAAALWDEMFHAASYLCKADTKNFAQRVHCFGSSQTRELVTPEYPQAPSLTSQRSRW